MMIRRLLPYLLQGLAAGMIIGLIYILASTSGLFKTEQQITIREAAPTQPTRALTAQAPASYAPAVDAAAPAVVNVYTTKLIKRRTHPFFDDPFFRRFFGNPPTPRKRRQSSLGSGVLISPQGYILTNNHVIDGSDDILVALHDGRIVGAAVVGTDPETDIAVLKIALDKLPTIVIGRSRELRVGDVVLAIGNPFGVGQTVTQGIVRATGRNQLGISTYENFIQTDAAINPGNSGGALINTQGELIGINTAIFSRSGGSQGIGFAIPVSLVKNVMQQIIEHGETIRGWLGIEIQTLTPGLAESFGLKDTNGVIIAGILRNGPADNAGLRAGDILTRIGNKSVTDSESALNLIAQAIPGTLLRLSGIRDGRPFALKATVSRRPTVRKKR